MPSFTDRDMGLKDLIRELKALDLELEGIVVVVGIREDDGNVRPVRERTNADGEVRMEQSARVADYATYNEYGLGVPMRPFMRSTIWTNGESYWQELFNGVRGILDGAPIIPVLDLLGTRVARDIQRTIVEMDQPPNSPKTIKIKGSANPLVDTGRMAASISHEVRLDAYDPSSGVTISEAS